MCVVFPWGGGEEWERGGEGREERRGVSSCLFVCLFVLSPTLPPPPFQFHFLCTLVLMALLPGKGKKKNPKKNHKADPSLLIRFSVAPDQISPLNKVSFLTRPGRSLHHPITPSLCSCFLMPRFYSLIPFACSTAAVLIYLQTHLSPHPLHPINKQRTKKEASTSPRTAAERKTLQNNEVRCRRHRHTADDETEKVPDFQRRGGSCGSRQERLKAVFLTAVACSRQHPGPRALSSPR